VTVNTGSNGGGNSGSGGTSGGGGGGVPNLYSCIDMETYENHCEIQYRRFMSKRSLLAVSKRDELYCTSTEACISLDSEAICYNPKFVLAFVLPVSHNRFQFNTRARR